jgi:hypothetical protein
MTERRTAYSVKEIDRMRHAIGYLVPDTPERRADIEDRLRTYMLNGTDPEELEAAKNEEIERRVQEKRERIKAASR